MDQNGDKVTAYFEDETEVTADLLIAADGIHSPIRKKLVPRLKAAGVQAFAFHEIIVLKIAKK